MQAEQALGMEHQCCVGLAVTMLHEPHRSILSGKQRAGGPGVYHW